MGRAMFLYTGACLAFLGLSSSLKLTVDLVPDAPAKRLVADSRPGLREISYDLKAPAGSKIIFRCKVVLDCEESMITVVEDNKEAHYCGPKKPTFSGSTVGNALKVTIIQDLQERGQGSYCLAEATRPYLNFKDMSLDSSEYGTFEGRKKTSCPCGWSNKEGGWRVLGGEVSFENEFPFIVSIVSIWNLQVFCGGSIISTKHILTAAHCLYDKTIGDLLVIAGEHDTTKASMIRKGISVSDIIIHEEYSTENYKNDIAVIQLSENLLLNQYVGRICMPTKAAKEDDYVKVMGWGITGTDRVRSNVLKDTTLRIIDFNICRVIFRSYANSGKQICTYSNQTDSCQGDSGGPIVWLDKETNRYVQVGIISFGKKCGSNDPGVNTEVYQYMQWIKKTVGGGDDVELCSKVST